MKLCPNCGRTADDDSVFCPNCGTPVIEQKPPEPQDTTPRCPNCGEPLLIDAAFCPGCGRPVSSGNAAPGAGYCPNCGELLPAGTVFCPNCGRNVAEPQPQAAPKKSGGKKIGLIVGISVGAVVLAAALIVAAVVFLGGMFSSPKQKFISYQQELIVNRVVSPINKAAERLSSDKFSSDLTVSASTSDPNSAVYLEDSSLLLKIDRDGNNLILNGDFTLMGSSVLTADVTYENGKLGFCLPELDDIYYVMDLAQVLETLTGEKVDLSGDSLPEFTLSEWQALLNTYLDVVYTAVTDENITEEKGKTVRYRCLNGRFDATVYTYSPSSEDIEEMLNALADHLEEDEALRSLILKLFQSDSFTVMMESEGITSGTLERQLDKALKEQADEIRGASRDIGRRMELGDFTWKLAVEGNQVRSIQITMDEQTLGYECSGSERDGFTEVFYADDDNTIVLQVENEFTKKGSVLEGEITVSLPGQNALSVEYEMDQNKSSVFGLPYGEYDLSVPQEGVRISLEVSDGGNGSADHTLSLRSPDLGRVEVTVNATEKGTAQKPSQTPTDISDYSYGELDELVDELTRAIQRDIMSSVMPFAYGW